jgi:hypothetical protein
MKTSFKSFLQTLALLAFSSAIVGSIIWLLVDALLGGVL